MTPLVLVPPNLASRSPGVGIGMVKRLGHNCLYYPNSRGGFFVGSLHCAFNWEEPEYASKGNKARLEEKLLQRVITFRMIAT